MNPDNSEKNPHPHITPQPDSGENREAALEGEHARAVASDLGLPADTPLALIEQELLYLRIYCWGLFPTQLMVGKQEERATRARVAGFSNINTWQDLYLNIARRNGAAVQEIRRRMDFNVATALEDMSPPRQNGVYYTAGEVSSVLPEGTKSHHEWQVQHGCAEGAAVTDFGGKMSKYQDRNEDTLWVQMLSENTMTVGVTDGAGSGGQGQLASRAASVSFAQALRQGKTLEQAFAFAREKVTWAAQGGEAAGVVAQLVRGKEDIVVSMMWAGDCKAMTLRKGDKLEEGATIPQNLASQAINAKRLAPKEFYTHHLANMLTGGFGIPLDPLPGLEEPGQLMFQGQVDDIIIIASDGFWDVVSEYEVEQMARKDNTVQELRQHLFELALDRNTTTDPFFIEHSASTKVEATLNSPKDNHLGDNITLVVLRLT